MPAPWIVILVVLVAIITAAVYFAAKSKVPEPEKAKSKEPPGRNGIPVRKTGTNINVPGVTPIDVEAVPPAEPDGVIGIGNKLDKVGDPALARRVSLLRSTNRILPDNVLFGPGDKLTLRAVIVDESSAPLEDVPVFWRLHAQRRDLSLPVRTDKNGVAEASYTVTENDMIAAGSYLVYCYAGGRALIQKAILHDKLFLPGEEPNY